VRAVVPFAVYGLCSHRLLTLLASDHVIKLPMEPTSFFRICKAPFLRRRRCEIMGCKHTSRAQRDSGAGAADQLYAPLHWRVVQWNRKISAKYRVSAWTTAVIGQGRGRVRVKDEGQHERPLFGRRAVSAIRIASRGDIYLGNDYGCAFPCRDPVTRPMVNSQRLLMRAAKGSECLFAARRAECIF